MSVKILRAGIQPKAVILRCPPEKRFTMPRKLFGKNIVPDCRYCDNCVIDIQGAQICMKNRCMTEGKCRKFSYNPLLRKPFAQPVLPKYNPEDFVL